MAFAAPSRVLGVLASQRPRWAYGCALQSSPGPNPPGGDCFLCPGWGIPVQAFWSPKNCGTQNSAAWSAGIFGDGRDISCFLGASALGLRLWAPFCIQIYRQQSPSHDHRAAFPFPPSLLSLSSCPLEFPRASLLRPPVLSVPSEPRGVCSVTFPFLTEPLLRRVA